MQSFNRYMLEYKSQMQKGIINVAYKSLMEYIMSLRTYFDNNYPDYSVSGTVYYGYMDMSYFAIIPKSFKQRKLKIAIVFLHDTCKFEVWLAAVNKKVQSQYWKLLKDNGWHTYPLVQSTKDTDSIIESIVTDNPDFDRLDILTNQIESSTLKFIMHVENFLSEHANKT